MKGIKKSFWLDAPARESVQAGSVPGAVVGAGENGTVRVAVGGEGNVVNVPSGGGVFEHGSEVRVQVDASGTPVGVLDAGSSVTEGGLVYAGAEGRRVREVSAEAAEAKGLSERAMRELDEARGRTAQDLESLRSTLQAAQGDVSKARLMFSSSEKDPKSYFRDLGVDPPLGAVYEQRGQGGAVEYRFRWDGQNWVEFNIGSSSVRVEPGLWARLLQVAGNATISGDLLAGGSVTADKVVASKELSAKVAKFDESVVSKLRAEKATISGDLIADTLVGKSIEGGRLTVNTSSGDGVHRLSLKPADDTGRPIIAFSSWERGKGWRNGVIMGVTGMNVYRENAAESPYFISWAEMAAAPYYRYASGKTRIDLQADKAVRAPLRADLSPRGRQVRVVSGTSVIVPESGRYRVTGWGAFWSEKWDTTTAVMLLRGAATDAGWGDLYGYAIAPVGAYATPSFTGLVDIRAGESISLGVRANAASSVYDYRFEVEFVCPL